MNDIANLEQTVSTARLHVVNVADRHNVPGRVAAALRVDGLAVLDGFNDRGTVLGFARDTLRVFRHPDSAADGITCLTDRGAIANQPGMAGFGGAELEPHTERSGSPVPPHLLLLVCIRPAMSGGTCLLTDGQAVYESIARADPALLRLLCTDGSARFGREQGYVGSIFEVTASGRIAVRLRSDDLAQLQPALAGRIADLHRFIGQHQISLNLRSGQGYLLDNRRWLHGRTRFTGDRLMYRVLGDPLPELNLTPGFTPHMFAGHSTCARGLPIGRP